MLLKFAHWVFICDISLEISAHSFKKIEHYTTGQLQFPLPFYTKTLPFSFLYLVTPTKHYLRLSQLEQMILIKWLIHVTLTEVEKFLHKSKYCLRNIGSIVLDFVFEILMTDSMWTGIGTWKYAGEQLKEYNLRSTMWLHGKF